MQWSAGLLNSEAERALRQPLSRGKHNGKDIEGKKKIEG